MLLFNHINIFEIILQIFISATHRLVKLKDYTILKLVFSIKNTNITYENFFYSNSNKKNNFCIAKIKYIINHKHLFY